MSRGAFLKIAEGLQEAIAVSRGEAEPAGLFWRLTPEQRDKALAYDGPEESGDPRFLMGKRKGKGSKGGRGC